MNHDQQAKNWQSDERKKVLRPLYRWLLTVALLSIIAWIIYRQDPEFLSEVTLNWQILGLATWLLALYTILLSERFRVLTQLYLGGFQYSTRMFLHSLVVSRVLNGVFPQAGNIYRGSHLLNRIGLPWSGYVAIIMAGMIIDIIAISSVLLIVLIDAHLVRLSPFYFGQPDFSDIVSISLAATVFCAFLIIFFIRKYQTFQLADHQDERLKPVSILWQRIITFEHFPGLIFQSLTSVTLLGMVIWLILLGIGTNPGLLGAASLMVAARAAQYVVITPGNLGVRELIYALVGSQLTIGIGTAVAASLLLRIMNWVVLGLLLLAGEAISGLLGRRH